MTFNHKYWESTIKDYKIETGTPESSDRDSDADSKADKSVDLDATNTQCDVDNQFLSEEFIYNVESDLELFEEEDDEANQNQANCGEDVIMSDAWDPRNRRENHRMDDFEENMWKLISYSPFFFRSLRILIGLCRVMIEN
ncbi:hypothetical protein O181_023057 [Austropuccinia psidii MF-1]|uniref:Uncharacterized protein n=1 Tax=Austropuccinia psidii MF-1 TaxID=1389203 RepID=A0A9Q3GXP9_9BASI|nr:hypothetical protein [Austropuccinia psidii MF-1]